MRRSAAADQRRRSQRRWPPAWNFELNIVLVSLADIGRTLGFYPRDYRGAPAAPFNLFSTRTQPTAWLRHPVYRYPDPQITSKVVFSLIYIEVEAASNSFNCYLFISPAACLDIPLTLTAGPTVDHPTGCVGLVRKRHYQKKAP